MRTLIICEKPKSAQRIAYAISNGSYSQKSKRGAYWFEFELNGNEYYVAPAVGHLFGLAQKSKGWNYPSFDVVWTETYTKKGSAFSKKYYDNLKELAKKSDNFIVATDYDVEGDVIAFNILRFICQKKDAKRMKFSTLTFSELKRSYKNLMEHMDHGQVNAGLLRHILDWYWGINTSRALMLAVKSQNRYMVLSIGRVQGPALRILADREKEIQKFKPVPYWQIILHAKELTAYYKEKKILKKEKAEKIISECKNNEAIVSQVKKTPYKILPPTPFNLTELQKEAYRVFKIGPSQTLKSAQNLYLAGLISYPRTSSEQLPSSIGYRNILQKLGRFENYKDLSKLLLSKKNLKPHNGKKKDPAHPAIYPTGEFNIKISAIDKKIFDLIVKRFLATFGESAIREKIEISVKIGNYDFEATGNRTLEENWFKLYKPYLFLKEAEFPQLKEGQKITVKKLELLKKETQPPKRYTPASLISELENKNLGTKSTRSDIIDSLYKRKYIQEIQIKVTDLGLKVIETLEKHCPDIISESLTRKFEEEMEKVRENKKKLDDVVEEAKYKLTEILSKFKKEEKEIGKELINSLDETRRKELYVGPCPNCGGTLKIIVSKSSGKRFIGCSNYSKGCRTSFPLPQKGLIQTTDLKCKFCGYPVVKVIMRGRKPWYLCINPNCPGKKKSE